MLKNYLPFLAFCLFAFAGVAGVGMIVTAFKRVLVGGIWITYALAGGELLVLGAAAYYVSLEGGH